MDKDLRAHLMGGAAYRAMFNGGLMIEDGGDTGGGSSEDDAAAKAVADKAAADKAAADKAAADKAKDEGDKKGPTDAEAALMKDMMKHKRVAQDAQKALEAATANLKKYEGIDPEKVRALMDQHEKAELEAAEKRGEYDRIIKSVRDESTKNLDEVKKSKSEVEKQLAAAQRTIDNLTVGASFGGSTFISENTVLSGDKARRLYGDHFDIVDGDVVAYDKPQGSSDRTPLVDANGNHLSFEAAIEKIVKSDPDFERIAKSKMRPGSGSTPSQPDNKDDKDKGKALSGVDLIAANLRRMRAAAK